MPCPETGGCEEGAVAGDGGLLARATDGPQPGHAGSAVLLDEGWDGVGSIPVALEFAGHLRTGDGLGAR